MEPNIRAVIGGVLHLTVEDITQALTQYTKIVVKEDTSPTGNFTTETGNATLVAGQTGYALFDEDGGSATYYKAMFSNGAGTTTSGYSSIRQGGTQEGYCLAPDVRKELATGSGNASIGQEKEDVIWDMCVEASRLIDQYKQGEPGAYMAAGSEARTFDGSGMERQVIEPATSITLVEVEETDGTWTTWTNNTDYYTWPLNASAIGEPIRALVVTGKSGTTKSVFTAGYRRVRVTGVFGIATTPPEAIARACKIQAARWFKRAQQAWQDASMNVEGQLIYTKQLDPDVKVILGSAFPHVGAGI